MKGISAFLLLLFLDTYFCLFICKNINNEITIKDACNSKKARVLRGIVRIKEEKVENFITDPSNEQNLVKYDLDIKHDYKNPEKTEDKLILVATNNKWCTRQDLDVETTYLLAGYYIGNKFRIYYILNSMDGNGNDWLKDKTSC